MSKVRIIKITSIIFAVALLLSLGGVAAASWVYPVNTISNQSVSVKPTAFTWEGAEVLPDDTQNSIGENHIQLIDNILFEMKYGLNAEGNSAKPIIHNSLNRVGDVLYCQQNVQGGNLKHLMIDGSDAFSLLFQVEYVSDTEYNLYTYSAPLIKSANINSTIEVFFTVLKVNDYGVWQAVKSYAGTAVVVKPNSEVPKAINSATFTVKTNNT